jgi:hypothetical protein
MMMRFGLGRGFVQWFTRAALSSAVSLLAVTAGGAANADPVPTPTLSTPPPGTRGFPFPNTLRDLDQFGYIQDELFIEGTARSYVPVNPLAGITDGRWDATPTGPTASYKSRLLIRRPVDPADFNGTVIVEWLNVSAGFDSDGFDSVNEPTDELLREGYAYVGVSAQTGANGAATNFLKFFWDPARYGTLSHPGDSYSYDIYSQGAMAILEPPSGQPAPLGNLTSGIRKLIAWGGSQSAARLFVYYNAVHPTVGLFDGFNPFIAGNAALAPLSQAPLPVVTVPTGAGAVLRSDVQTPVLWQNSESEFISSARGLHSQPDSKYYRLWEHAGMSHANRQGVEYSIQRLTANGIPVTIFPPCGDPPINDTEPNPAWRAMVAAMNRWVNFGVPPAKMPRAQLSIPADPALPATIVRDPATGLAKGGIRMPDVAVPTRTLSGVRPPAVLQQFPNCVLFGTSDPWNGDSDAWDGNPDLDVSPTPEPSLSALYQTEGKYVAGVTLSSLRLALQGLLRPRDVVLIIQDATTVDIP